jgi:hypothetical protein
MLIGSKENIRFTSKYLWCGFLISTSCVLLAFGNIIDPHRDWSGLMCLLSGLVSVVLMIYSWARGERQIIFLFIVFFAAINALLLPLICVAH